MYAYTQGCASSATCLTRQTFGLSRHIVEVIREAVRRETATVNLLVHQEVALLLRLSVHRAALGFHLGDTVPITVVYPRVVMEEPRRYPFQQVHKESIIAAYEAELIVQVDKLIEQPLRDHFLYGVKRQR